MISGGERRQIAVNEQLRSRARMFIDLATENVVEPAPSEECEWVVSLIDAVCQSADEKHIIRIDQ